MRWPLSKPSVGGGYDVLLDAHFIPVSGLINLVCLFGGGPSPSAAV
ncbi:rCG43270 [Rattus norvegicus]|uniref:RCG43270 n=1 Tax=Rattus norvegicus TaxID=10116 RepID=A6IWR0_RAT|nr:rCG43270 [Rattus norvegicus]